MNSITFVALDVHKDSIAVAVARSGRQEPEQLGVIPNTPEAVARVLRKLGKPENLEVCYEAGPCGYAIYRQLSRMGISCVVVAPSLIPKKPGERVKTDRRDALKLARLLRSGDLTPVRAPGEDQEAMRDLVRARESAKQDVQRKRNELGKFLLRYDLRPPKGTNPWTRKHRQWLESLQMTREPQQVVLRDYLHALDEAVARLQRLEQEIGEWTPRYCDPEMLKALQAMRGGPTGHSGHDSSGTWRHRVFSLPRSVDVVHRPGP